MITDEDGEYDPEEVTRLWALPEVECLRAGAPRAGVLGTHDIRFAYYAGSGLGHISCRRCGRIWRLAEER